MMTTPLWASADASIDKPNAARIYDYLLGGYHNFAVDRAAGDQLMAINPDASLVMQSYRAFQRRAVRFFIEEGIDQFLDVGSVTPTVGSTHEVAQALNPAARVVYVDIDPDAVQHSATVLKDNVHTAAIQVNTSRPEQMLAHPELHRLLDFNRPVAVLLTLLHFIPIDEQAYRLVDVLREAMHAGSYIAVAHGTNEGIPQETTQRLDMLYARSTTPVKLRSHTQIVAFFKGMELVPPGVVYAPLWRPESSDDLFLDDPQRSVAFAGVACKS